MHPAREYLKGLIDQGYAWQKPQQNIYMANSALRKGIENYEYEAVLQGAGLMLAGGTSHR